jgi:hypothetical protein
LLIGVVAQRPGTNVVPQMRPGILRDLVHRLARDTANISWSVHALERMAERDIRDHVVIDVLRHGEIKGDVEAGKNPGEWKVKLTREAKGRREAGVVVLVVRNARLFVKTAEWEDLK